MNLLSCVTLAALCVALDAAYTRRPPKVQLYSREPGQMGEDNTLICRVSHFHPPDISLSLRGEDGLLPDSVQTDLAFGQDWHFHLTRSAPFRPQEGKQYTCRVEHGGKLTEVVWDPNM
ncbi:unnamed protein product [Knipowitschia caucasica]|uniref:Beta-2-microglobulin n=1 Tax=Knipowitschia caucasica TaxID=637954 RepID=A0AAV2IQS6_KNICA